jgi:DNA transposition AAA+ family ATPase
MKDKFVITDAAGACGAMIKSLDESSRRREHSCDIALITSPAGCGMTTMLEEIAACHDWPFVVVHSDPNPQRFLNDVFRGVLHYAGSYHGSHNTRHQIVERLKEEGRPPLIIDSCDRLGPRLVDIAIDIGDSSGSPIVLGGRSRLRSTLLAPATSAMLAANSRLMGKVELKAPSLADARLLAAELVEVEIARDLVAALHKQAGASIRSLLTMFYQVEYAARIAGTKAISMQQWGAITGASDASVIRQLKHEHENNENLAGVTRHGDTVVRVA